MPPTLLDTELTSSFAERTTPGTDRRAIRLTDQPGFAYPLYYYISSVSADGRYLVFHHAFDGEVQLHRLDLATGQTIQLTDAASEDAHWRNWCTDPGRGVLDHRSVLNVARNEVVYFDGRTARCVDLESLSDRRLFDLGSDRRAISQNAVTPDGNWLLYIHHDRELFDEMTAGEGVERHRSVGTVLAGYHFAREEHRELVRIDSPIHHVTAIDNHRVLFCHPATENGMLMTDLDGGWYTHLRTQDADGGRVCHYHPTRRGITYEVLGGTNGVVGGVYDPSRKEQVEFTLPTQFGYTHTGFDPAGSLFFYENATDETHDVWRLERYGADGEHTWDRLVGHWPTAGGGQKAHFHPRLTPDREWMLMTAGVADGKTNGIFLVDVADVDPTAGIQFGVGATNPERPG